MKVYRYLFYRFYELAIATGNEGFYPEANALFLATAFPWVNIMTGINILELFLGLQLFYAPLLIALYFLFLFWSYKISISDNQFKMYATEFEKETTRVKYLKAIAIILYIFITCVAFVLTTQTKLLHRAQQ